MRYIAPLLLIFLAACGGQNDNGGKPSSDFLVTRDGFSFANYGNANGAVTNLTDQDVAVLCGVACVRGNGPSCKVTYPLESFEEMANNTMAGGHCYGMAILSQSIFKGHVPLSDFDANAQSTYALPFSTSVQEAIAVNFAKQMTKPAQDGAKFNMTPNDVLNLLRNPGDESYALGIFQPDFSRGHAVTAIRVIDDSASASRIEIYDNNYPGNSSRFISVDRVANTWSYGPYTSLQGLNTLIPIPLSPTLEQQHCPVESTADDIDAALTGEWLVTTVGGAILEDMPNTERLVRIMSEPRNEDSPEPHHYLPAGHEHTMKISGASMQAIAPATYYYHRKGHSIRVQGIVLEPEQSDDIVLGNEGRSLSYAAHQKQYLTFRVGADYKNVNHEIAIRVSGHDGGATTQVLNEIDFTNGEHALRVKHSSALGGDAHFRVHIGRRSAEQDDEFDNSTPITIASGECVHVNYGAWKSNLQELTLTRDPGCDGHALTNFTLDDDVQ